MTEFNIEKFLEDASVDDNTKLTVTLSMDLKNNIDKLYKKGEYKKEGITKPEFYNHLLTLGYNSIAD